MNKGRNASKKFGNHCFRRLGGTPIFRFWSDQYVKWKQLKRRTFYAFHSRLWKNTILQFGHLSENVSEAQYLNVSVVLAIAINSDLAKNLLLILSTTDTP